MIVREVLPEEKDSFNAAVSHPLQSWEWGEFKNATGKEVVRLGVFETKEAANQIISSDPTSKPVKMKLGYQITVHPIPQTSRSILYFPRGPMPDKTMLNALSKLGKQKNAIMVKMEPNVAAAVSETQGVSTQAHSKIKKFLLENNCQIGRPFFYQHTFQIDLTKSKDQLLQAMHSKTRYNIRLSQRHQVEVIEDNSQQAYETFIKLFFETTKRQKFYGQTPGYYRKMREILVPAGIEHLFLAKYKDRILAAYIFFVFQDILYYVYGGSSRLFTNVMPTYALIWHAIQYGKKQGLKKLDLWASLGPKPDPNNPWYGFHRFKSGFGGQHLEFIGTYDLVVDYRLYPFYNLANEVRWKFLKLKAKVF